VAAQVGNARGPGPLDRAARRNYCGGPTYAYLTDRFSANRNNLQTEREFSAQSAALPAHPIAGAV
jgi:hypothetical protein